ncbi:CU044_2847 family protein [Streptomyces sp. NPDC005485]|uniref:CU044_2847 family protein n=1 Tax=Streptomyces sp. NPDC005485 TaxID=3155591 RepID=UPI0033A17BD5
MSHIQEIELPDGTVVTARVGTPDSYGGDDQDVGFLDVARSKVEDLGELISGVGTSVLGAARAAGPDEAAITFGVEITAKEGMAMAVLARGEAKASLQVTLTWQFDKQRERDARSPASGSPASGSPDADAGTGTATTAVTTGTSAADPAPHD